MRTSFEALGAWAPAFAPDDADEAAGMLPPATLPSLISIPSRGPDYGVVRGPG